MSTACVSGLISFCFRPLKWNTCKGSNTLSIGPKFTLLSLYLVMASLIPGFQYDIFISYRHKDNKGGHWVTEFVDALRTELEATFKEDISIYFDENPHDGLRETHDVDKSLKDKLKCLIFIPIISQTYCDPKSFAWQHELCAFNQNGKRRSVWERHQAKKWKCSQSAFFLLKFMILIRGQSAF